MNHSQIEKLGLLDYCYSTPKEFFEYLKENTTIKSLNIFFWDDAIYDMIVYNQTLEILKIIETIYSYRLDPFLKCLEKNPTIKKVSIDSDQCCNLIKDFLASRYLFQI